MIKKGKKRITLTLSDLTTSMLEKISEVTGETKSKIMSRLLFEYTMTFWLSPQKEIIRWQRLVKEENEKN